MKPSSKTATFAIAFYAVFVGPVVAKNSGIGKYTGSRLSPRRLESIGNRQPAQAKDLVPGLERISPPAQENDDVTVNIIVLDDSNQSLQNAPARDPDACTCSCLCPYDRFQIPSQDAGPPTTQEAISSNSQTQLIPTTLVSEQASSVSAPPVEASSSTQEAIIPLEDITSPSSSSTPQTTPTSNSVEPSTSSNTPEAPETTPSSTESSQTVSTTDTSLADETTQSVPSETSASSTTSDEAAAVSTTTTPSPPPESTETEDPDFDPGTMELHSVLTLNLGG